MPENSNLSVWQWIGGVVVTVLSGMWYAITQRVTKDSFKIYMHQHEKLIDAHVKATEQSTKALIRATEENTAVLGKLWDKLDKKLDKP